MTQKSLRLTILLAINIAVIALSLILLFYPTSTVSAMSTASSQGFILDEQSIKNTTDASWILMQDAIFQPVLKMLTLIGAVTMSFILLSKIFTSHF
jgi:hypothetical protein